MEFTPPHRAQRPKPSEEQQDAVLRLIAYGGERPVVVFPACMPGGTKEARLRLVNATELNRVSAGLLEAGRDLLRIALLQSAPASAPTPARLTTCFQPCHSRSPDHQTLVVDKLPASVTVLDEHGVALPVDGSISVAPHGISTVCLVWHPEVTGSSLSDSVRWRMAEGSRQVRLECRVQGALAGPPVPARTARGPAGAGSKAVAARATAAGAAATAAKPVKAAPVANKAPQGRVLSLGRPVPPVGPAAHAPAAARPCVPPSSGALEPAFLASHSTAAAVDARPPLTPQPSHAGNGARAGGVRILTPLPYKMASPSTRACGAHEVGGLDFRRVMSVESKRERGLLAWMNSEVAPLEAAGAGGMQVEGPALRRLLGDVSGKAYLFFKRDAAFAATASKLEAKIALKQLVLKDAELTLSDVVMRKQALEVLTAYHPFWLAVGLQTVLGQALTLSPGNMLALMRPDGEVPAFLRSYLAEHLLADPDLALQFRQDRATKGDFWEVLGGRVLGRTLLLMLLLDRLAQRTDLPAGAPSLFRQDASFSQDAKSSQQVLQAFLQPRLAGAGDVRHTMRVMAYELTYVQHARDEADFRVHKPSDLRDGTRLAKLLDNLRRQGQPRAGAATPAPLSRHPSTCSIASTTSQLAGPGPDEALLPSMFFPQHTGRPLEDAQMRNNLIRFARALQQQGVSLSLQGLASGVGGGPRDVGTDSVAKAVAEGLLRLDQRVTLGVLWQVAMHYKLRRLVDARTLEREAARLQREARAAEQPGAAPSPSGAADDAVLLRYFNDPTSQALLSWMRAACAPRGVRVENFTWALADGRALCYLINSYLPEALPLSRISVPVTPSTADEAARLTGGTEYVRLETLKANGWAAVYEMGGAIHDEAFAAAYKAGVAANFAAAHAAAQALGVPAMLCAEDYLHDGPDELAAILFVALLAQALLRLTAERRAGYVIMEFFRRRRTWQPGYMRASLARFKAAARREQAATALQAYWRMVVLRRRFVEQRRVASVLQAYVRRRLACRLVKQQLAAVLLLQASWRAYTVRRRRRVERLAATTVQAAWRGYRARSELARRHAAATVVQAHIRRYLVQKRCLLMQLSGRNEAATEVQAWWRMVREQRKYQTARRAAVTIQAAVRGFMARKELRRQAMHALHRATDAAIVLQAAWRGFATRRRCVLQHRAAVQLQSAWRGRSARLAFLRARGAAGVVQSVWRAWCARRALRRLNAAASSIQAAWRALVAQRQLQKTRTAVILLQAAVRGMQARKLYATARRAAIVLQAGWRGMAARRQIQAQHRAAVVIQAWWRAAKARRAFLRAQRAAVVVQSAFRGCCARKELARAHVAAAVIQLAWRRHRRSCAATVLQAFWRMKLARWDFRRRVQAATTLQAYARGLLQRLAHARLRSAATAVQGLWRCRQARGEMAKRAERFYADLQRRQVEMLLEVGRQYMRKVVAAIRIQASWRGLKARQALAPVWEQHRQHMREQRGAARIQAAWRGYAARKAEAGRRYALEVLSVLLPIRRARKELLLRRHQHAARACVRGWLARGQFKVAVLAAMKIQAMWRGHAVRLRDGRAKREARQRLEQAAVEAQRAGVTRHIGYRAREALELLLRPNTNLTQVLAAVEVIDTATRYSRDCCKLIARNGGLVALLRFVRSCNRSKPHVEVLHRALAVLHNICRCTALVSDVFHAEDCLTVLSEVLQFFRDTEEVFRPTAALLQRLVAPDSLAAAVPPATARHWEGIHQVLYRKADMERKYLDRLEGQKGSDVSARESTRKLLVAQQQVQQLEALIARVDAAAEGGRAASGDVALDQDRRHPPTSGAGAPAGAFATGAAHMAGMKNTLVKDVVQRMTGGAGAAALGPGGKGGKSAAAAAAAGQPARTGRRA
ncbi:Abnormal spindle-like microcephaly-associated [Tetrabaena socialis]|uniref:Abnormal spindle-like microcephaly-associated n=1 Tax=Tetrabaena socialis TaxID=47790 RepID=A0A2J8ACJ6_9CHLO|nr:Abnormal spindle-like microcephaly-associated [Tetrabaena socialis]|eukprot:PNH10245.1 Abnormal spindle-like microcephaly-associated [Tetrabaena socialis]